MNQSFLSVVVVVCPLHFLTMAIAIVENLIQRVIIRCRSLGHDRKKIGSIFAECKLFFVFLAHRISEYGHFNTCDRIVERSMYVKPVIFCKQLELNSFVMLPIQFYLLGENIIKKG